LYLQSQKGGGARQKLLVVFRDGRVSHFQIRSGATMYSGLGQLIQLVGQDYLR